MSALRAHLAQNTTLITRTSEHMTADHAKQVISALQVWCHADLTDGLFNSADRFELPDIPKLVPYFFVEPDYGSREAKSIVKFIPQAEIGRSQPYGLRLVVDVCCPFSKDFDRRHPETRTGRVSDGVAEIMDALVEERSVARLRSREIVS